MAAKKQSQKRKNPHAQQSTHTKINVSISAENRPLLSIGMIFRDDIRCIERCLQALQPLRETVPCQLVMADTGSVDGSRAVAERYADLVIDFPWINDFSAARNAVMDRCTGVWYLTVDTDEYLDEDFTQLTNFLLAPTSLQYSYGFVIIRNYNSDEMLPGDCNDFSAVRIQRNDLGKRYRGAIHESWYVHEGEPACDLLRVIFHHDGYAPDIFVKKQKRNMLLLKKEQEESPRDISRILQCLESCYTREDARKYAELAIAYAEEFQSTYPEADRDSLLAAVLRQSVQNAYRFGFHELEEWSSLAKRLMPDSVYVRVDISFFCASYVAAAGKQEQCLEELSRYWSALECYDRGEFDPKELRISALHCSHTPVRQEARLMQGGAFIGLKRWAEALDVLSQLPAETTLNDRTIFAQMRNLFRIWRESDVDCFPLFLRNLEGIEGDDSKLSYQRRETFLAACRDAFGEERVDDPAVKRKVYQLFLQLDETHDLGRAARIMETYDPEAVRELLSGVAEWKFFPTEAIDRALSLGVLPPAEFYRQKTEVLNFHAAKLISLREKDTLSLLELWDEQLPSDPSVHQVVWLFYLTASAVQKRNWKQNGSDVLFELFRDKTALYLDVFSRPELCTEEFIQLQPPLVRFGWYCIQAGNAWDSNNPLAYTRWLKKALRADPEMRDMVEFLSKRAKNLAETPKPVSPELLALANQVRMILAAYPAEHPAVLAIKQSEAYQQVAYLLT